MKQTLRKNYYELLDLRPDSPPDDIERKYRSALKIYDGESNAVYSLYSPEEKKALIEDLNKAYETLRDPVKKSAYDSMMNSPEEPEDETYEINIDDLRSGLSRGRSSYHRKPAVETKHVVRLSVPVFTGDSPDQMVAEQYRILYTKLEEISSGKGYSSFAVTSAVKGEGKSVTSLNLAYLMATDFKKRTILVEGDLRKPSTVMSQVTGSVQYGLSDVLTGKCDLHSAITRVEGTNLYILPAGPLSKNSSELIGSDQMRSVMSALKAEFDFVVLDAPPVLPLVDVSILSRYVDGLLFVVRAGRTSKDLVLKALSSVASANTLGIVLNGADLKLKKYYY